MHQEVEMTVRFWAPFPSRVTALRTKADPETLAETPAAKRTAREW